MRADTCTGVYLDLALRISEGRRVGVLAIQTFLELLVRDLGSSCHQIAHVHLRRAAEHHPVLVHHHHGAITLDGALNLARGSIRSHNTVQHRIGRFLLELHRGVAAHVEAFPIQYGFAFGLLDGNGVLTIVLCVHRTLCAGPDVQIACSITIPQPALHITVRHTGFFGSSLARGFLCSLLSSNRTGGTTQVLDRTGQLLTCFGMLACRRVQKAIARINHATLCAGDIALYRSPRREPRA